MTLPSKELLSEILGLEVYGVKLIQQTSTIRFIFDAIGENRDSSINIYELAHKCKEWAYKKEFKLLSGFDEPQYENSPKEYSCIINHIYCEGGCRNDNNFIADTEPEAVFKASQWIYDNKETK